MDFSKFFIDRPIFAAVLSIVIFVAGLIAIPLLPISEYPDVVPPTVVVRATYPGANPKVIADTVAAPLEEQINGAENMMYMKSVAGSDGVLQMTITFRPGTDPRLAQVDVQNRVNQALSRLPAETVNLGVTTQKQSPSFLTLITLISDGRYDPLYLRNYINTKVKDELARLPGVGQVQLFGGGDYAMRIWLDPNKVASRDMTANDVLRAVREQNLQVSAGQLGAEPIASGSDFLISINAQGRLRTPEEFGEVILKTGANGEVVRLADVARIELGANDYTLRGQLDDYPSGIIGVFQAPGANALAARDGVIAKMDELAKRFPPGVSYRSDYDSTIFVRDSIRSVVNTLLEAIVLVVLVVILFLQTWRASIIPLIAVPVSVVGTFAVLYLLGFSINTLSLFGLVLAIGIVVDDAIVVVENVERNMALGMDPREASYRTMEEVGGALVAIALVLSAVFVPSAFITGISGQFYLQFALTIAGATVISLIVSLTLSPALCALLLKPHAEGHQKQSWLMLPLNTFFRIFNWSFDKLAGGYSWLVARMVRFAIVMLVIYAGLLAFGMNEFRKTPIGFIPAVDGGYLITVTQLPPASSLDRTNEVNKRAVELALDVPGVAHAVNIVGFSGATRTNASNSGAVFVVLKPFEERAGKPELSAQSIQKALLAKFSTIQDAMVLVVAPPPVRGIGSAGGFRMMVQDRSGAGPAALQQAVGAMMAKAAQTPGLMQVFSMFETSTPQLYLDIDRVKAQMLGINVTDVFTALQTYLGSAYVNDFNLLGRTFRVTAQADSDFRNNSKDVLKIRVRNSAGDAVPLGTFTTVQDISGPSRVPRYNLYPAAELDGAAAPGYSQGQAIDLMQKLAAETLPQGFSYEWTEIAYQQIRAGDTAVFAFALGVVFVFLVLAAQFESLTLPLAVILIVPMSLIASITGVIMRGQDNNILTQVGFIVLIGLAAKNAILIVEFAAQLEAQGKSRFAAATEASRLRMRPIIMTSLAFILGVVPLVWATGAGAELRQVLGTAVFAGMIGVTVFGLIFTPVFYVVCRWLGGAFSRKPKPVEATAAPSPAE